MIRINAGVLFSYFADAGSPGAAIESGAEFGKLVWRADGVDFNAAVRQISCVTAQLQALGGALREIPEADTLYISRDEVALGLFVLAHETVDCNREAGGGVQFRRRWDFWDLL